MCKVLLSPVLVQHVLNGTLLHAVSFSKAEAERYLRVHQDANQKFQGFLCHGAEYINRHLLSIMSLLGPLRRCCSGGALRKRVRMAAHGLPKLYYTCTRQPISNRHAVSMLLLF